MPYNHAALTELADGAFAVSDDNPLTETQALVASLDGKVVFERYAEGLAADSTFLSWSMGKSVASALCGVLVAVGRLELDATAPVPAWHGADDPRAAITLRHLLQMRSGLSWNEDYVDDAVSDVIEMLFGSGQHDVAGYAAGQTLVHEPGAEWLYSSGTTNIITRIMGDVIGGGEAGFTTALIDGLLRPAGMQQPTIRFDDAETWIGSSFLYATARDYVAFGELFRNDGIAPDGSRLLPEGWVAASIDDHATCPDSGQGYGYQWWLARDDYGSFAANGYEGQRLQVSQKLGLTFVRLGKTTAEHSKELRSFYAKVADCFA
jgi:CubicO group peptidase (beta-lactamase class C family)